MPVVGELVMHSSGATGRIHGVSASKTPAGKKSGRGSKACRISVTWSGDGGHAAGDKVLQISVSNFKLKPSQSAEA